jgi:hypothetical protein
MDAAPARPASKTIVVPRQLEGFFYERLRGRYAHRPDVLVVLDRRVAERRSRVGRARTPLKERRYGDRRSGGGYWSLAEMPFAGA